MSFTRCAQQAAPEVSCSSLRSYMVMTWQCRTLLAVPAAGLYPCARLQRRSHLSRFCSLQCIEIHVQPVASIRLGGDRGGTHPDNSHHPQSQLPIWNLIWKGGFLESSVPQLRPEGHDFHHGRYLFFCEDVRKRVAMVLLWDEPACPCCMAASMALLNPQLSVKVMSAKTSLAKQACTSYVVNTSTPTCPKIRCHQCFGFLRSLMTLCRTKHLLGIAVRKKAFFVWARGVGRRGSLWHG